MHHAAVELKLRRRRRHAVRPAVVLVAGGPAARIRGRGRGGVGGQGHGHARHAADEGAEAQAQPGPARQGGGGGPRGRGTEERKTHEREGHERAGGRRKSGTLQPGALSRSFSPAQVQDTGPTGAGCSADRRQATTAARACLAASGLFLAASPGPPPLPSPPPVHGMPPVPAPTSLPPQPRRPHTTRRRRHLSGERCAASKGRPYSLRRAMRGRFLRVSWPIRFAGGALPAAAPERRAGAALRRDGGGLRPRGASGHEARERRAGPAHEASVGRARYTKPVRDAAHRSQMRGAASRRRGGRTPGGLGARAAPAAGL